MKFLLLISCIFCAGIGIGALADGDTLIAKLLGFLLFITTIWLFIGAINGWVIKKRIEVS